MPVAAVRFKEYRGERVTLSPTAFLTRAASNPYFQWPYPIARAILEEEARPDGVSITRLLYGCLRCEVLKVHEPYVLDIEDAWSRMRGTAYHSVVERYAQRGSVAEVRFFAALPLPGNPVIHGKPDLLLPEHGTIIDLKTTKQVPMYDNVWSDHEAQLNGYRWLVNHAHKWDKDLAGFNPNTWEVTSLGVWYVDDKGPKPLEVRRRVEVATTSKSARSATKTVKVPRVWADEEVEAFLLPKYEDYTEAMNLYENEGVLPPYPKGFDFLRSWVHQYSPVAEMCVARWLEESVERGTLDESARVLLDSTKLHFNSEGGVTAVG